MEILSTVAFFAALTVIWLPLYAHW